jgi:ketosteroid isomerase-like protein
MNWDKAAVDDGRFAFDAPAGRWAPRPASRPAADGAKTPEGEDMDDRKAIEELVGRYVDSINTCDPDIVDAIWSHGEGVSFVAPAGRFGSYEAIRDDLVMGVFARNFQKRCLRKEDLEIHLAGNMAWAEFTWSFDAVTRDGKEVRNRGLETQIMRKDGQGAWKLVHIHYSRI